MVTWIRGYGTKHVNGSKNSILKYNKNNTHNSKFLQLQRLETVKFWQFKCNVKLLSSLAIYMLFLNSCHLNYVK